MSYGKKFLSGVSAWAKKRAAENFAFLTQFKLERGCIDCGYREHSEALDFDHVRGIKLFEFASAGTRKPSSILEEIAKCEVVCANCHRIRTFNRRRAV